MQVLVETREVKEEGFLSLLGKNVEVFCGIYIYAGKLVGVNEKCIKLANPHLVYETGAFTDKKYKDAQPMNREHHYIALGFVESFGETAKL
jgi:hypothetical protein